MKTFSQLNESLTESLTESSLSRIWSHVEKHQAGAISGYRDENAKSVNKSNNREIKAYLLKKGYSVTRVQGNYIENHGTDKAKEVGEPSFFVVDMNDTGKLDKDLIALGKRFEQDSILIVPKGGKGAYLYGTTTREDPYIEYNKTEKVGNGKYGKVAGAFLSRIRGREFAFESVTAPGTRNGKWGMSVIADAVEKEMIENGHL